jgi:hypothetical protein
MMGLEDRCIRKPAGRSLPTTATRRVCNMARTKKYRLTAVVRRMQFGLLNPVPSLFRDARIIIPPNRTRESDYVCLLSRCYSNSVRRVH